MLRLGYLHISIPFITENVAIAVAVAVAVTVTITIAFTRIPISSSNIP